MVRLRVSVSKIYIVWRWKIPPVVSCTFVSPGRKVTSSVWFWVFKFFFLFSITTNYFAFYTVSQKNPCDYVFDGNLNSKRPIVIIFGTVIT